MADNITASGGLGSKELQQLTDLKNIMVDLLGLMKESKKERFSVQADTKSIDELQKKADTLKNTFTPTKAQLFNTKEIQKEVSNLEKGLRDSYERLAKNFKFVDDKDVEKFADSFARLKAIMEHFGVEFNEEYMGMARNFLNNAMDLSKNRFKDIVKGIRNKYANSPFQDSVLMEKAYKEALETGKKDIDDFYDHQISKAKEEANQINALENQKRQARKETINQMKTTLSDTLKAFSGTASDNQYLDIDLTKFAELQDIFMNLVNLLTEMGFDTKELDEAYTQFTDKIYISKQQLEAIKKKNTGSSDGVLGDTSEITAQLELIEKLKQEITDLKTKLAESPNIDMYDEMLQKLERLERENEELIEQIEWYEREQMNSVSVWSYSNALDEAKSYEDQLKQIRSDYESMRLEFEQLLEENRELQNLKGSPLTEELRETDKELQEVNRDTTNAFNPEKMERFTTLLSEIAQYLKEIQTALGKVGDDSGFTNIIQSVEILLERLNEIQQKVGSGIYNIQVNQGIDKTAQERSESVKEYTRKTMTRYSNAYDKIVSRAGNEEKLFAYINNVLNPEGGISELINAFSSINVGKLGSSEEKVYRLINFFKILRQAAEDETFGLDLSGISIPSSSDTTFRSRIRELSGIGKKEKLDAVLDFDAEKTGLNDILEKLNEIKEVLNTISQKDLFSDSINNAISKLDIVIEKFDTIISKIETIGNTPIRVTNQKDRHDFNTIKNTLTGEEISQEAYDVLDKLKNKVDVSVNELRTIPDVVEGFRQLAKYTNEFKEKYSYLGGSIKETIDLKTEERQALRDYIVQLRKASGSYSGVDKKGTDIYNGEVEKGHKATIVMGLPASGKSSALVNPLSEFYKAKVIDSDMIKELLPEFAKGWGASLVHEESGLINKEYLKQTLVEGENVIIPIVGSTVESVLNYIDMLKKAGYDIELTLNELENEETSFRNLMRFFNDGRFLEPGFVREYGNKPSEVFEQLIKGGELDGKYYKFEGNYLKYNNNVERGQRPRLTDDSGNVRDVEEYLRSWRAKRVAVSEGDNELSRTAELQRQIKLLDELLNRRRELIELKKQYAESSDSNAVLSAQKEIEAINGVLLSKYGISDKDIQSQIDTKNKQDITQTEKELASVEKGAEVAKESINEVTQSEKQLKQAAKEFVDEFSKIFDVSSKTKTALKKTVEDLIKEYQSGKEIDFNKIHEIAATDSKFIQSQFQPEQQYPEYYAIKERLRSGAKIRYSDYDKAEFGDVGDWNHVRGVIGISSLVKNGGQDPIEFLSEIGILKENIETTQDALRFIYETLKDAPDLKEIYYEQLKQYGDAFNTANIEQLKQTANKYGITPDNKNIVESEKQSKEASEQMKDGLSDVEGELDNLINKYEQLKKEYSEVSAQHSKMVEQINNATTIEEATPEGYGQLLDRKLILADQMNNIKGLVSEKYGQNIEELIGGSRENTSAISQQTADATRQAADAITEEGNAAEEAKKKKEGFANANKNVANSANTTADATRQAADAITEEGEAARKAGKDLSDASSSTNTSDDAIVSWVEGLEEVQNQTKYTAKELRELYKFNDSREGNNSSLETWRVELENLAEEERIARIEAENLEKFRNRVSAQRMKLENVGVKDTEGFKYSQELTQRIEDAKTHLTDLKHSLDNITPEGFDLWKTKLQEVSVEIKNVNNAIKEEEKAYKDVEAQAKKTADEAAREAEKQAKAEEQLVQKRSALLKRLATLMQNGKIMKEGEWGNYIRTQFNQINSGAELSAEEIKRVGLELDNIESKARSTGKSGATLFQILQQRAKSLFAYLGTFASFYRIIGYVRQAFTTIKDLDTQLVDLRKTTTMTASELNEFYYAAANVGKQLGVTTSEIISQAAAWSRLGYSTKEAATEMAEMSSKFAAISPGMTTDQSTDYLVSTMQAYGIAVDEVERKILDNVNRIGNTFATTNAEIGEMLTRSSAAMKAANNSLEETIALESAAVEITRNAETTGTAFRTVSMRIRGKQSMPPYNENYMLCA